MKKRMILLSVIVCFVILGSGVIHSQTALTIGGHYWYAQPDYEGGFEGLEVDPGHMYGPYLNLRIGKLALGSSLLFGTFTWEIEGYDLALDVNRKDLNFSIGFSISRRFTIFGAIKLLTMDGEIENEYYDEWNFLRRERLQTEDQGTLYGGGISGVIPFTGSPLFLFWSAAYLFGTMESTSLYSIDDVEIWGSDPFDYNLSILALTGGLGVQIRSGLTIMIGYRADLSNVEEDAPEEKIHGIMVTATYTIR